MNGLVGAINRPLREGASTLSLCIVGSYGAANQRPEGKGVYDVQVRRGWLSFCAP